MLQCLLVKSWAISNVWWPFYVCGIRGAPASMRATGLPTFSAGVVVCEAGISIVTGTQTPVVMPLRMQMPGKPAFVYDLSTGLASLDDAESALRNYGICPLWALGRVVPVVRISTEMPLATTTFVTTSQTTINELRSTRASCQPPKTARALCSLHAGYGSPTQVLRCRFAIARRRGSGRGVASHSRSAAAISSARGTSSPIASLLATSSPAERFPRSKRPT